MTRQSQNEYNKQGDLINGYDYHLKWCIRPEAKTNLPRKKLDEYCYLVEFKGEIK